MAHCCQNSNLAVILFDGKKNTFLNFLKLFSKSKKKTAHCCQYGNLSSPSRLQKFLPFQHKKNDVALSYIEKTKICVGEIAQLPVLLVQRKFLKFKWWNASHFCNTPCLDYHLCAPARQIIDSWMCFSIHFQSMLSLQKQKPFRKNHPTPLSRTSPNIFELLLHETIHQFWTDNKYTYINFAVRICKPVPVCIPNLQHSYVIHDPPSQMKSFCQRSTRSPLQFKFDFYLTLMININVSLLKYTPPPTQWLKPYLYQPFTLGHITQDKNFLASLWSNPAHLL